MSVKKLVGFLLVTATLTMSTSVVAKLVNIDFKKEIAQLVSEVNKALQKKEKKEAGEINKSEQALLHKELSAIKSLYDRYNEDKKITEKEAKVLKAKLKKSDLNLFRKRYD